MARVGYLYRRIRGDTPFYNYANRQEPPPCFGEEEGRVMPNTLYSVHFCSVVSSRLGTLHSSERLFIIMRSG